MVIARIRTVFLDSHALFRPKKVKTTDMNKVVLTIRCTKHVVYVWKFTP